MDKKDLRFLISFVIAFSLLLFYSGTSITGYTVGSGLEITPAPINPTKIIFFVITTFIIIAIGAYYFTKRSKL